jgi:hypothetical protein
MPLKKWFKKDQEETEDSVYKEYTLDTMKVGYLVDHDLQTWQVSGYNTYDYDGELTQEWELQDGDEVRFLERAKADGKVEWTLTRAIGLNQISEEVARVIKEQDDPPQEIHFEQRSYTAVEASAGLMQPDGEGNGREFVSWSYESSDERLLFISQWGEADFTAYEGEVVEEYQFTDILPGESN